MEKQRTAMSLVLIALGAALLLYGLSSRADIASSDEQAQVQIPPTTELAADREVAKGAVAQETPPQVKKPEEEAKKAPAACPT